MAEERVAASHHSIDVIDLGISVFFTALWVCGFTLQTATTEAVGHVVQNGTVRDLFLSTISQVPGIITGSVTIDQLPVVFLGWGIEVFNFALMTRYNKLKGAVNDHHPLLKTLFFASSIILWCFCLWTDWIYAQQVIQGWWQQALFTLMITVTVIYCGPAAVHFAKHAFGKR